MNATATNLTVPYLGRPDEVGTPGVLRWLATSRIAALGWTAMRIWLGVQWIQAGMAKLWGAENSAFLHHGGAGVAGFATHGAATYTWWHSFLTGFVVPNSGWIGVSISVAEFALGIALVLGLLTPLVALGGLSLNMTYMLSGTAGVNPVFMIFSIVLIVAWRTSGWIGVDGLIMGYRQHHSHTLAARPTTTRRGLLGIGARPHAA
jgi:thiosulfate dehydrogenase (quinone) large subunit